MMNAITMFSGVESSQGKLPLVLVPKRRSFFHWHMIIPDGVYVVLQKFGKDLPSKKQPKAGFHFYPPWYHVSFLVSQQSCIYNAPVKGCPTMDNVKVQVDISLVFRIKDPKKFVYDLGAIKFDDQLQAAVEEATRGLVRGTKHDQVYELRGSSNNTKKFLQNLNNSFEKYGVAFSDASITNVQLPAELTRDLENETKLQAELLEHNKQHEYSILCLNNQARFELKKLEAENERIMKLEKCRKDRSVVLNKLKEVEAQEQKQIAIIKEVVASTISIHKAQTDFNNGKLMGEKDALAITTNASKQFETAKRRVDSAFICQTKISEGKAVAAVDLAESVTLIADAENSAAKKVELKRAYDLAILKHRSQNRLRSERNLVVSGKSAKYIISAIATGDMEAI